MPTSRKLLGAAAFSLALAGGGAAGALLGTPSTSGAQDPTSTTAELAAPADGQDTGRPGFGGPGGPHRPHGPLGLEEAAETIGITADELKAELEAGTSIAEVAEAHDVDPQTVIDAMVAKGKEWLQELEDQLPERVAEVVNRKGLPERGGPHGGRPGKEAPGNEAEADAGADA